MTPPSDALRNTLDTLHLDPKAKEDRHYLITVLRRLGYTEEEIRAAVEEKFDPVMAEPDEDRMIEVEYMASSEVREFEPVVKMVRADEMLQFIEIPPEEVDFVEVRPKAWGAESWTSQPWAEQPPVAEPTMNDPAAEENWDMDQSTWPEPEPEATLAPSAPVAWPETLSETDGPAAAPETTGAPAPAAVPASNWGTAPAAVHPSVADAVPEIPEPVPEIPEPVPEVAAPVPEAAVPEGPYEYNGYTLHARDVELSTGKSQRIFFFAKGTPRSGIPAGLPEGYEVRENDRTGLPFLARLDQE